MTPSMGMAAPKGTQAPAAGLAAIAQPATAPRGKSPENMGQIMALARKMSDAQLADVLAGKSLDVPQFAAMTEAMGRKSLRQAVQGQQAMAQGKQPSLKDKLMGEYQQEQMAQMAASAPQGGGLPGIPAPNMESMDMASGGIVAFQNRGFVDLEEELKKRDDEETSKSKLFKPAFKEFSTSLNALEKNAVKTTPTIDSTPNQAEIDAIRATNTALAAPVDGPTKEQIDALNARPKAPGAGPSADKGLGATDEFTSYMNMVKKNKDDYLSKVEGLSTKQREGLAQLRKEGGGEALMQMAAALFGSPNLSMAAAKGLPMVASTSAATRKEARQVEQAANEMDLNLAKAREAAARGDMESALMFKKLADDAKYKNSELGLRGAMLNQEPNELRTLRAIMADPKLAAVYKGGKGANVISREAALKEWGDLMPNQQKKYGSFNDYYNAINSTIGGGTDLQAQAAAELARRKS